MFTKLQESLHRSSLIDRSAFRTATLLTLGLVGCIATGSVVLAQSELDQYGHDMTSSPGSVESKPFVADSGSKTDTAGIIVPETTQSMDVIRSCGPRIFPDCSTGTEQ
jgi:hypothetical protein